MIFAKARTFEIMNMLMSVDDVRTRIKLIEEKLGTEATTQIAKLEKRFENCDSLQLWPEIVIVLRPLRALKGP